MLPGYRGKDKLIILQAVGLAIVIKKARDGFFDRQHGRVLGLSRKHRRSDEKRADEKKGKEEFHCGMDLVHEKNTAKLGVSQGCINPPVVVQTSESRACTSPFRVT
jgi:hypothetical protein